MGLNCQDQISNVGFCRYSTGLPSLTDFFRVIFPMNLHVSVPELVSRFKVQCMNGSEEGNFSFLSG